MSSVKLVAVTRGVGELEGKSGEEIVAYVARVSNPANQHRHDTASKIIRYCLKNGHFSIFETVNLTVEIKTSRAIAAQILRHRSFTFQEFCVAAGTMITTDKGGVAIEDIDTTNKVRTFDTLTKSFVWSNVKELFSTGKKGTYTICLEDGRKITCTKDHKFMNKNMEFVPLEEILTFEYDHFGMNIKSFDKEASLCTNEDGVLGYSTVKFVAYSGIQDTYDLETEHSSHNYLASGIVTHNSQRYSKPDSTVIYEARRQDTKNRQNSVDDLPEETKEWFTEQQMKVWEDSKIVYDQAIEKGIAKECARFLLPIATETTLYMTSNLRNFIFYCKQRAGNGTQKEHLDIAFGVRAIIVEQFPSVAEALDWTT